MPAPKRSLPPRPSLDQQKKLAKELLAAFRADDADAVLRVRDQLPDKPRISLTDAQFTLAREYGFKDWSALKLHIERATEAPPASLHETLKRAFDARDLDELRALFRRHPQARALVDAPIFDFDSPALVHFAGSGDEDMVDLLLEMGADPNRRTDWWAGGFHALHSAQGAVAARLMEAGAVPDACAAANLDRVDLLRELLDADPERVHERGGDGQTPLHFARSREVADLLLERGADVNARDVDHRSTPAQWMLQGRKGAGRYDLARYLVERGADADVFLATALGLTDRLESILEADPSQVGARTGRGEYGEKPPGSHHIYTWTLGQNLSPLQVGHQFDQPEAAAVIARHASLGQRLVALCMAARGDEARALLRDHPGLMDALTLDERRALTDAAWAADEPAVTLMLDLGFDATVATEDGATVLHNAAWQGSAACIEAALRLQPVRALIEVRERTFGSTALGWCCHGSRHRRRPGGDYPRVARLLLEAGAIPGPNLDAATEDVLAVIHAVTSRTSRKPGL